LGQYGNLVTEINKRRNCAFSSEVLSDSEDENDGKSSLELGRTDSTDGSSKFNALFVDDSDEEQ